MCGRPKLNEYMKRARSTHVITENVKAKRIRCYIQFSLVGCCVCGRCDMWVFATDTFCLAITIVTTFLFVHTYTERDCITIDYLFTLLRTKLRKHTNAADNDAYPKIVILYNAAEENSKNWINHSNNLSHIKCVRSELEFWEKNWPFKAVDKNFHQPSHSA